MPSHSSRALALRVALVAVVILAAHAAFASTVAVASTASERPPLSIDRSDRALSDGEWDELQQAMRMNSTSAAPAQFTQFGVPDILTDPAPVASDECGRSVALGDVNLDGRADALVGCDGNSTFKGNALLFLKNAGAGFTYDSTLTDPGPVNNDQCGFSVALGDVNFDGRADAVIGCQGDNANRGNALVFTKNVGVGFTWDSTLTKPVPAAGDLCGRSVAVADMNKDGRGDVLIGCHGASAQAGTGLMFTKNSGAGFTYDSAIVDPAPVAGDFCGSSIALGDVNADGRADAVLGCYGDTGNKGNAVVFTKNVGVGFTYNSTLTDPAGLGADYCGWLVAMGDVNQDGRDDVMLGCFNDNGGRGDAVLFTKNSGAGFTYDSAIVDPNAVVGDSCGSYLAMGDVNADGRADALLACNGDNGGRGNALVFTKSAGVGFAFDATLTDSAPVANDYCGWGVALGDWCRTCSGSAVSAGSGG